MAASLRWKPHPASLSGPSCRARQEESSARQQWRALSGFERIITFDMGGTSTDVALVDGEPRPTNEAEIAGLPVRVPMLDIHTVGAGGGSLARFDAGEHCVSDLNPPVPTPAQSAMGADFSRRSRTPTCCSAACSRTNFSAARSFSISSARVPSLPSG